MLPLQSSVLTVGLCTNTEAIVIVSGRRDFFPISLQSDIIADLITILEPDLRL